MKIKALAMAAALITGVVGMAGAATVPLGSITASQRVAVEGGERVVGLFEVGPGTATEIALDLSVRHRGASWGSETRVIVVDPDDNRYRFLGDDDFGWGDFGGVFSTMLTASIAPVEAEGVWRVVLRDSFADPASPDYFLRRGSTISVLGTPAPVPLPASAPLALLGIGALAFMRARRKTS